MFIAGIDEAGRGCALGPLVVGIAVIKKENEDSLKEINVRDSKELSEKQRVEIYGLLKERLVEFKSIHIPAQELNELMPSKSLNEIEAMKMAALMNGLKNNPELIIVDCPDNVESNFIKRIRNYVDFSHKVKAEHKADQNYLIVGAASIVAKVERDNAIKEFHKKFGDFGSGYSHDEKTINFIKKYVQEKDKLPPMARIHWATNQNILNNKHQTKLLDY